MYRWDKEVFLSSDTQNRNNNNNNNNNKNI